MPSGKQSVLMSVDCSFNSRDYSSKLTVFCITVGAPDYPHCIEAINAQDCKFKFKIIAHISPMSKAFQQMLDKCDTEYFIQCDEDMIMRPHCVRTLYENMVQQDQRVAMVCHSIWDIPFDRWIQGIKIYRHSILKKYPYHDNNQSCEMEQVQRMQKDGFIIKGPPDYPKNRFDPICMADHGLYHSPRTLFERCRNLFHKWQNYEWMGWLAEWPQKLMDRYMKDPNEMNLYAVLGTIAGLSQEPPKGEKDFNTYSKMKDFANMSSVFCSPPQELNLYMTGKCNYNCHFCRRIHQRKTIGDEELRPQMVSHFLGMYPSIHGVCIAGFGEPLIAEHFDRILEDVISRNKFCGLITNGSLLLEKMPILKTFQPNYVSVSLNAVNAKEHFAVNRTNTWPAVISGIEALQKAGIYTQVTFVVHRDNYKLISEAIKLVESLGVGTTAFINMLPHYSDSYSNESFWSKVITDKNQDVLSFIQEQKGRVKHPERFHWPVPISKDSCPSLCNSPFTSIGIDGSGGVSGCRRVTPPNQNNGVAFGEGMWMNSYFTALRQSLRGGKPLSDVCRMCFGNWQS